VGQGSRRNKPITATSLVSIARIKANCRTCGRAFEVDPVRAVTGVANSQETTSHCDRRCKKLAPAVAKAGKGPCQACTSAGPTVLLRSGIRLCVPDAWAAFGACLRKPQFATINLAGAAIPLARPEDAEILRPYSCQLCAGAHLTKGQAEVKAESVAAVREAYARLGLSPDSDRTAH
jgi:hypothetical protein